MRPPRRHFPRGLSGTPAWGGKRAYEGRRVKDRSSSRSRRSNCERELGFTARSRHQPTPQQNVAMGGERTSILVEPRTSSAESP